jgi:hypothetical protein
MVRRKVHPKRKPTAEIRLPAAWDMRYHEFFRQDKGESTGHVARLLKHVGSNFPETLVLQASVPYSRLATDLQGAVFDQPWQHGAPRESQTFNSAVAEVCDCTLLKPGDVCAAFQGVGTNVVCGSQWPPNPLLSVEGVAKVVDAHSNANKPLVLVTFWGALTVINTKARQSAGGVLAVPLATSLLRKMQQPAAIDWLDRVLDQPTLKQWFVRNPMIWHPKVVALPIGLSSHHTAAPLFDVVKSLEKQPKTHHLLVNFGAWGHFGCTRDTLAARSKDLWPFAVVLPTAVVRVLTASAQPSGNMKTHGDAAHRRFYDVLSRFRFAVSPAGTGWDCYRTWEAIWLGVIPIVLRTSTSFDLLFDDLPVLLVDDYAEVTLSLLDSTYDAFEARDFDLSKLTAAHWIKRIRRAKAARGNGTLAD